MQRPPKIPTPINGRLSPALPPATPPLLPAGVPPVMGYGPPAVSTPSSEHIKKSSFLAGLMKAPWPIKVLVLITVPAVLIFGATAIGVAGIFGAIGMPILLPIFFFALAVVGIVTVVKSLRKNPGGATYIVGIVAQIARDENLRRLRKDLREAMVASPVEPKRQPASGSEAELRQRLLTMNPFDFERHVLAFFQEKGLFAWVTQKSNDAGVDGFARHPEGLIVVQCKRNAPDNPVGRPVIQQFKGVVEENGACRGYVVTTSYFTDGAVESAATNTRLRLIDMEKLICWHKDGSDLNGNHFGDRQPQVTKHP